MQYNVGYRKLKQWQDDYLNGMTAQEWVDYSHRLNNELLPRRVLQKANRKLADDYHDQAHRGKIFSL